MSNLAKELDVGERVPMSTLAGTFGPYRIDARGRTLALNGAPVELRPKCFDLLCFLAANAGSLSTKDAIAQAVWPDVVMTDESLSRCVSDIRHALGDAGQQVVKTVPRRGYAFVAPFVAERTSALVADGASPAVDGGSSAQADTGAPPAPYPAESAERRTPWRWRAALALGLAALAALVIGGWTLWRTQRMAEPPSIALLPFAAVDGDAARDYFIDGLCEDITMRLSKFSELVVIANGSAVAAGRASSDPRVIGARLGARYLVDGTVRRDGSRIRISARLVEAESGRQRWAESFEREASGVFALQDELARRIVELLVSKVTQAELERANLRPANSLGAYELFLHGRALLNAVDVSAEGRYAGRLAEARRVLQQAVNADGNYAPALAALSDTYNRAWLVASEGSELASEYQNPDVGERALALAERAVIADPTLPEAHAQMAWVLHWRYRRDLAMAEFRRAFALNPNMAEGRFALLLLHSGKPAEAIEFLQHVLRLDPLHRPIYFSYLANAYYLAGDYRHALETSRLAVDRMPAVLQVHVWHAAAAAQLDLADEARAAAAAVLRIRPDFTTSRFVQIVRLAEPAHSAALAAGLRKAGLPE